MRGVVLRDSSAELVDELQVREPGVGEVLVRVEAAGICHTDLSVIDGTIPFPKPLVLGHEGAGTVVGIGPGVASVAAGDHVVLTTLANCGVCAACERGWPTRCRRTLGNMSQPFSVGGEPIWSFAATSVFSEYVVVSAAQVVAIDPAVPLASAALIGCGVITGACCVWNRARVRRGDAAVVFGVGGVGLSVIQALRIAGARSVVAIDRMPSKETMARTMGATHFFDAAEPDLVGRVRALEPFDRADAAGPFNGGGFDWAFDCVGNDQIVRDALEMLEWGGSVVILGVPKPGAELTVPFSRLIHVDRAVMGCRYGSVRPHHDIPMIVDLYLRGEFLLDEMVSATYDVGDFHAAVDRVRAGDIARAVLTF
jgi:S-(hydroxymethyl)glutathione dehydrogenase/alcohol dehydrogenase